MIEEPLSIMTLQSSLRCTVLPTFEQRYVSLITASIAE